MSGGAVSAVKLAELEPQFLVVETPGKAYRYVDTLAEAQGIRFLCPKCFSANGGPAGTHSVICWFKDRDVPATEEPLPGRWTVVSGHGYGDLTLTASILITSGCMWHGFVTAGEIVNC